MGFRRELFLPFGAGGTTVTGGAFHIEGPAVGAEAPSSSGSASGALRDATRALDRFLLPARGSAGAGALDDAGAMEAGLK